MNFDPEKTIATGHQPVLLHPGLLIKFQLAWHKAKQEKKNVIFLIADHDEGAGEYLLPELHRDRLNIQKHRLCDAGIYARSQLNSDSVIRSMQRLIDQSPNIFENPENVERGAQLIVGLLDCKSPAEFQRAFLRQFFESPQLPVLLVTELCQSSSFQAFVAEIGSRSEAFRIIHNEALQEYRVSHQIKNKAQPLPDLYPGELPFWIIQDNKRIPLTTADDLQALQGQILPRALSLSLFVRLFVAQTFVHGTGGGRYDRIADVLLSRYYEQSAPPSPIATATLKIRALPRFGHKGRPVSVIETDLRKIQTDPIAFLPDGHSLVEERSRILAEPTGAARHAALLHLKQKGALLVDQVRRDLEQELEQARIKIKDEPALGERTYPYFCYDEADRALAFSNLIKVDL